MSLLRRTSGAAGLLLALTCVVPSAARAALPYGVSGPWYNPAQSGHGLSISLVEQGRRAAVIWHVYDAEGEPLTLYVDGVVRGRDILGTAFAPRGMRFAEFDPQALDLPEWGEVTIRFDTCESATLSWTSTTEGFSDGSVPIVPLAPIESLPCSLPPPNTLAPGLYRGRYLMPASPHSNGWGVVDGQGRLWGGTLFRGAEVWQTPSFVNHSVISLAEVSAEDGGTLEARLLGNRVAGQQLIAVAGSGEGGTDSRLSFRGGQLDQDWEVGAPAGTRLIAPVDVPRLMGDYRLPYLDPPLSFVVEGRVRIEGNGELCVTYRPQEGDRCNALGRLSTAEGEAGLIDFELRTDTPGSAVFRGRGWLARVDGVETLSLVGWNGDSGVQLVARR